MNLSALDRLLDALPTAICRFALDTHLPRQAPPQVVAADLLERTRLDYQNPAFVELESKPATALIGLPLGAFELGAVLRRPDAVERFVRQGFSLERVELRVGRAGLAPKFLQATLLGEVTDDRVSGCWAAVDDVSAARDLARRVAVAEMDGDQLLGRSIAVRRTIDQIAQVAGTDTTVLITGETGTGKELIARAIHRQSARAAKPLVAVNCGAISPSLVESELFGHERGAFTGALGRKVGRFELADGGTLFLDEIGDLPLDLQVKLLRVLQEGEFTRVGGTETIAVDVRVIAATHRDLRAAVQAGSFRQDLYYRLNVFPIKSPPLRDRRDDIPLLASHFTQYYAARLGKRIDTVPGAVLSILSAYPWPGNVRELANLIERSVIITQGTTLQLGDWATGQYQPVATAPVASAQTLDDHERHHIVETLEATRWKVSGPGGAAERLRLKPTTLEARMRKLGIVRPR